MVNSLPIGLQNNFPASTGPVFAFITGLAINDGDAALCLIQADGQTPYFPPSPAAPLTTLTVNCAIPLGAPGTTVTTVIPQLASARVWFSIQTPLVFLLNPGPSLVEPSVANPTDPNINTRWGFCELTLNADQLYANVSYVDFVSLPISIGLTNMAGVTTVVQGLPPDGLDRVCDQLMAQHHTDGAGWDQLIVRGSSGENVRVLSPNLGMLVHPGLFENYFEPYIDLVWNNHRTTPVTVDTQASWGIVQGTVQSTDQGDQLVFPGLGGFSRPSTADIFSCSTGPFITMPVSMAALTPRIAAGCNRSTLHRTQQEPSDPSTYYQYAITNHYSRILHAVNTDGRGYAFPYDDVTPSGGHDQSGSVFDPNPSWLTIAVGAPLKAVPPNGSNPPVSFDATAQIRAENFTDSHGVQTEPCTDTTGGRDVGWISNGDWIQFNPVDFGSGQTQLTARVASGAPAGMTGQVQVAIDGPTAAPVGSVTIANTGGWQNWTTVTTAIDRVASIHTLYLTFASARPDDFVNLNWFRFAPGPDPGSVIDAASRIRAENFDASQGIQTQPTADDGGGNNVGWIANGDWIRFDNVDFHAEGMTQFLARVSSGAPDGVSGLVQAVLDDLNAAPIGSFAIANTGGWQSWRTVPADIHQVTGVHTLYLTFVSGQPLDFVNINWFTFSSGSTPAPPPPPPVPVPSENYKTVLYFPNYVIYARGFNPPDFPADLVTHANYAFADVHSDGEVVLSDTWADTDKHFPGDSWNDPGTNVYGCIKQLFLLKKRYRQMKVVLSIGGWGYRDHFAGPIGMPQGRTKFAQSAVALVKDLGLDGIDIDWEYPADDSQAGNFVDLLREIRAVSILSYLAENASAKRDLFSQALDAYSNQAAGGYRFLLTVACPAGPSNYQIMHLKDMDQYLDMWNLMTYDMAGAWDTVSGHQANIYKSASNPSSTAFGADEAIRYYTDVGQINPSKICLGMPIYGRAFLNTDGPGQPFSGVGEGSWEAGVWDYKALPLPGATEYYDPDLIASWSYDPSQRMMVTYDTPEAEIHKSAYIKQTGLGGAMWWECSADRPKGDQNLVWKVANALGGGDYSRLDRSNNLLDYPQSKYDNLRSQFPNN